MIEVERIIENGKSMGLMPQRQSISVGATSNKIWQTLPAHKVRHGDIWVDHGLVDTVDEAGDGIHVQIRAGEAGHVKPEVMPRTTVVKIFGPVR